MSPHQPLWDLFQEHGIRGDAVDYMDSVGPGWHGLVRRLVEDLVKLGWNKDLHQLKEKFGGLRFYVGEGSQEVFDRIDLAERESLKTCEECGKPGELRAVGWWKTRCDGCAKQ